MTDLIVQKALALQKELSAFAMDPANPPTLLPVTKKQPAERILPLVEAGITSVGESRVQEIVEKYCGFVKKIDVQLIGRLQTNKIKYIISTVSMIQSLDRWSLAQAIDAKAKKDGRLMPVLVEVNMGKEAQKAGVFPEEAIRFVRECSALSGIAVRGLMTVMPNVENPETLRPLFRKMRGLFERIRAEAIDGVEMSVLSMGMSNDWRVAAQEGATMVRLGSAIFG